MMEDKPLAEYLREENDLLAFKMQCNAMKGKTFTMEEGRKLCEQRAKQLDALNQAATIEALKEKA